jgi:hypothetical protein
LLGLAGLLLLACNQPDYVVTVELTGSQPIQFTGWYKVESAGSDSTAVSGTTPKSWSFTVKRKGGDAVTAFFAKTNQPGTMTGRITADSTPVEEKSAANPTDSLRLHWAP